MGTVFGVIVGIIIMALGLYLFLTGRNQKDDTNALPTPQKDGLPILPRSQRHKPTFVQDGDPLSSMAAIATTHDQHAPQDNGGGAFAFGNGTTTPQTNAKLSTSRPPFSLNRNQDTNTAPQTNPQADNEFANSLFGNKKQDSVQFDGASLGDLPNDNQPQYDNTQTQSFEQPQFNQPQFAEQPQFEQTHAQPQQPSEFDQQQAEAYLDQINQETAVYDEFMSERMEYRDKLRQFDGETTALDQHFHEQEMQHDKSQQDLQDREPITLLVRKKDGGTLDGNTILTLAQDYAMRYGALKMFHRYENADGTGERWFSMLGMVEDSVVDFDLVELSNQVFRGVALFFTLPHPQALRGFDSMVSVAQSIADEINAEILSEKGESMDNARLQSLRNMVASYS